MHSCSCHLICSRNQLIIWNTRGLTFLHIDIRNTEALISDLEITESRERNCMDISIDLKIIYI